MIVNKTQKLNFLFHINRQEAITSVLVCFVCMELNTTEGILALKNRLLELHSEMKIFLHFVSLKQGGFSLMERFADLNCWQEIALKDSAAREYKHRGKHVCLHQSKTAAAYPRKVSNYLWNYIFFSDSPLQCWKTLNEKNRQCHGPN